MLLVPGGAFSFGNVERNYTRAGSGVGTAVTPVVGSKGAWAQAIASLSGDTYGLMITIHNSATSAANRTYAVDIGVGAAGSEVVIIPDLIGSSAAAYGSVGGGHHYYFPIFIPAGSRVAVRAQGSVVTAIRVNVQAYQQPANPAMVRTCSSVEEIGLTGVVGTALTVGTTAEGAWTLVGTTTQDNWWWQLGVQVAVATVAFNSQLAEFDIAVGDGTNFRVISEHWAWTTTTAEDSNRFLKVMGCEAYVPSGSSIYVRGQTSGTANNMEVAVYGAR